MFWRNETSGLLGSLGWLTPNGKFASCDPPWYTMSGRTLCSSSGGTVHRDLPRRITVGPTIGCPRVNFGHSFATRRKTCLLADSVVTRVRVSLSAKKKQHAKFNKHFPLNFRILFYTCLLILHSICIIQCVMCIP